MTLTVNAQTTMLYPTGRSGNVLFCYFGLLYYVVRKQIMKNRQRLLQEPLFHLCACHEVTKHSHGNQTQNQAQHSLMSRPHVVARWLRVGALAKVQKKTRL